MRRTLAALVCASGLGASPADDQASAAPWVIANGQTGAGLYMPREVEQAYAKGTRSPDGRPGPNYWQNHAEHRIRISLSPPSRRVQGEQDIVYTNNSPDPLSLAATVMAGATMLIVYAGLVVYIERRTVTELALPPMGRELGLGLLLGFGLYSACMLILMALGNYRIDGLRDWHILLAGMATALATGVFEELLFRGGVFRLTQEWFGSWVALIVSSLVFGFVHWGAEGATLQGLVSISVWAGLLLSATYLLTGRLWLGIGLHAAWNYTQGTVYSGIVSGNAPPEGFFRSSLQGSEWLTGGSFGAEASLVALGVCSTVGVLMLVGAVRRGHIVPPSWKRTG